jgi:putative sigma-54 modulation protein
METKEIKITFEGMESTQSIKDYVIQKISKHEENIKKAISVEVTFINHVRHKGIDKDFQININVVLPKSSIHIQEIGDDLYKLIDSSENVLGRRFKRYFDKFKQWEGEQPWEVMDIDYDEKEDEEIPSYEMYVPKISVREKMKDMKPMEEAEAIEMMELSGKSQLLFKSKKTSLISMVYKRRNGSYGLVEPLTEI